MDQQLKSSPKISLVERKLLPQRKFRLPRKLWLPRQPKRNHSPFGSFIVYNTLRVRFDIVGFISFLYSTYIVKLLSLPTGIDIHGYFYDPPACACDALRPKRFPRITLSHQYFLASWAFGSFKIVLFKNLVEK
jgi:hypothetical protein